MKESKRTLFVTWSIFALLVWAIISFSHRPIQDFSVARDSALAFARRAHLSLNLRKNWLSTHGPDGAVMTEFESRKGTGPILLMIIGHGRVGTFEAYGPIPTTWKIPPRTEQALTDFAKSLFMEDLSTVSYTTECQYSAGMSNVGDSNAWAAGRPLATVKFTNSATGQVFGDVVILRDTGQVVFGQISHASK